MASTWAVRGAEDPTELVAEAVADVVGVGLERHPEDPDGHAGQVERLLHAPDHVQRESLVHHHGGRAEGEGVVVEGGELHSVLEQARASGQAGFVARSKAPG